MGRNGFSHSANSLQAYYSHLCHVRGAYGGPDLPPGGGTGRRLPGTSHQERDAHHLRLFQELHATPRLLPPKGVPPPGDKAICPGSSTMPPLPPMGPPWSQLQEAPCLLPLREDRSSLCPPRLDMLPPTGSEEMRQLLREPPAGLPRVSSKTGGSKTKLCQEGTATKSSPAHKGLHSTSSTLGTREPTQSPAADYIKSTHSNDSPLVKLDTSTVTQRFPPFVNSNPGKAFECTLSGSQSTPRDHPPGNNRTPEDRHCPPTEGIDNHTVSIRPTTPNSQEAHRRPRHRTRCTQGVHHSTPTKPRGRAPSRTTGAGCPGSEHRNHKNFTDPPTHSGRHRSPSTSPGPRGHRRPPQRSESPALQPTPPAGPDLQDLTVLSWNLRGFKASRNLLLAHLDTHQPHIILLQETLVRHNNPLKIPGYRVYSQPYKTGLPTVSKGMITAVRFDLPHNPHIDYKSLPTLELQSLKLPSLHGDPIIIVNLYAAQRALLRPI